MKTKIIYISGNEIFDMRDIQAAFNQVRDALQLGNDTVLFGVPVDRADALVGDVAPSVSVVQPVVTQDVPEQPAPVIATPVIEAVTDAPVEAPVAPQKKSRGRPKSAKKSEPETNITTEDVTEPAPKDNAKVVSILSVLTAKQEDDADQKSDTPAPIDTDASEIPEPDITTDVIDDTPIEIDAIDIVEPVADVDTVSVELSTDDDVIDAIPDEESQAVSVDDIITDDAPVASQEQTLEQLLESMAPLREDIEHEHQVDEVESFDETVPDTIPEVIDQSEDDATLEQLATEFAENQDKIATTKKTENQGKIGKLKNILPFKKARRDDAGLMGDLFGWAGIAANDEDFAIPGFFTNAASKK